MSNRFHLKALSAVNLLALGGLLIAVGLPKLEEFGRWRATQAMIAAGDRQAELEKRSAERQREVADVYKDNQVADISELVMLDYVSSPAYPPQADWTKSVDTSRKTFIYDQNRLCVGYAYQGVFHWIFEDPNACNQ